MEIATAIANSNIAIIKYWGNRDDTLILPLNSSLSFTMDDQLQTKTTVLFDEEFTSDELWIDDEKSSEIERKRVSDFLDIVRKKANTGLKAKVFSENSFPKGAGLASSASAFAALAGASTKALELELSKKELSMLSRFGSGSASRSIFGGAVEWKKGEKNNGSDCYAEQLFPKERFKDLKNIIAIVEKKEKKIGSREGMKITTKTSKLLPRRLEEVEKRLIDAKDSIFNFQKLASIIMEESDSMHRAMSDSSPQLIYLNKTSHNIIEAIKDLNSQNNEYMGAYTFDAGPNAHVYTTDKNSKEILSLLKEIEGVKEIIKCSIGDGIRFSNSHLM